MKPAISVIPITPDERDFISAVLAADAVPHYGRIGSAAAIIAATEPGPDGMVQVVLEEADRDATFHRMTFHHLELVGVQGFRRAGSISGPSPIPRGASAPMRDYGVCRLQDRPIDGMIFKGVWTSTKPEALKNLFAAPVLDVTRILDLLKHYGDGPLREHLDDMFLVDAVYAGYYVDSAADARSQANLDLIRRAFEVFAAAGVCKLIRKPAIQGKRKHSRVIADWNPGLYLQRAGLRAGMVPPTWLSAEDEQALADIAGVGGSEIRRSPSELQLTLDLPSR